MRDRIRKNLQNRFYELKDNLEFEGSNTLEKQAVHNKLLEALTRFDDAPIHTIHGFCQSILQQYAFENSKVFELELTDDDGLYERLLHEQQRTHWLQDYGTALADILKLGRCPLRRGYRFGPKNTRPRPARNSPGRKLSPTAPSPFPGRRRALAT